MTERRIAFALVVATAAALGLSAVYVAGGQPQLEGALLGVSLGGVGIAVLLWARHLFPDEEVEGERPALASRPEDLTAFEASFEAGERSFARRRFLTRLLGTALGALGLSALFPIRSLGPSPGRDLFHTAWRRGSRLVTEDGRLLRPGDLEVGGVLTVFPQGHTEAQDSATLLIRVEPELLQPGPERADWSPEGHIAYSKICTHVACPVGLYQEDEHRLLCPCHQSTFEVLHEARPVFGPATRPLPQLPLAVDDEGYLVARSDYPEPIGPAFWNRQRT
ncbi:MAG: cytochrome bc1 complex Rieske iron-sulfur subunit [Acidimicrobiia bacterium]